MGQFDRLGVISGGQFDRLGVISGSQFDRLGAISGRSLFYSLVGQFDRLNTTRCKCGGFVSVS